MNPVNTSNHPEQPKKPLDITSFQRRPAETPGAYSAFISFLQLGQGRALQGVADQSGVSIDTIKKWSSKFEWNHRLQSFYNEVIREQAQIEAAAQRVKVTQWYARMEAVREQQFLAALNLLQLVNCCIETFSDEQLEKVTLSQIARGLMIASKVGRAALAGIPTQTEPALPPVHSTYISPAPISATPKVSQNPGHPPCPDPISPASDALAPENREKIFTASESAEKCHSLSDSKSSPKIHHPTPDPAPTSVIDSQTVNLVPSCPSRAVRPARKIFPYRKSAEKCRSVSLRAPRATGLYPTASQRTANRITPLEAGLIPHFVPGKQDPPHKLSPARKSARKCHPLAREQMAELSRCGGGAASVSEYASVKQLTRH